MINIIFGFLIIVGILYSFITGNIDNVTTVILESTNKTITMTITIFAVMALWLGIMNIAATSGLLSIFTKILKPILVRIFPSIPKNHESFNYIASNMVANMFGLGNAATPLGIKAMNSLKTLTNTDTASDAMITFLIINTTGFTIIPTTIISLRMASGSVNNQSIIPLCILSSFLSLITGLLINYLFRKCHK